MDLDSRDRPDQQPLLDFRTLGRRLRSTAWALAAAAAVATLVEVVRGAAIGAAAVRWGAAAVAGLLLVTAVLVALQAYRAADTIQGRGERLSSDDVGLRPPRPPPEWR